LLLDVIEPTSCRRYDPVAWREAAAVKAQKVANFLERKSQRLGAAYESKIDERSLRIHAVSRSGPRAGREQPNAFVVPDRRPRHARPFCHLTDEELRHAVSVHRQVDVRVKSLDLHVGFRL
jgi:hypothetical protein